MATPLEELQNQIANLEDVKERISGYVDVEDGDEERGPRPNRAMQATTMLEEIIRELTKIEERI